MNLVWAPAVSRASRPSVREGRFSDPDQQELDGPRRLNTTGGIEVTRKTYAIALFAALGVLALAGCGGGGSSTSEAGSSSNEQPASSGSSEGGMTLTSAEVSGLGAVLVDSEGFTVYEFGKDNGTTSSCYGACEENWPPVTTKGAPTAGEGAMSSHLGTTKRKDGTLQVTYAGHPLYTFVEDKSPGEANGNELEFFGGKWSVLNEAGSAVEGSAGGETEATEESSSGGGYGY
jgi:predicted lipoprotein with Yx(FWY)xxD motif